MEAYLLWYSDDDTQDFDEASFPWLSDEIEARSAENIRSWTEYLPDDCLATMIALGWDQDT
jgi:hypothetical protein